MSNIKIRLDNQPELHPVSSFTFSGGEQHVSLKGLPIKKTLHTAFIDCSHLHVIARLQSSKDLVDLLLVTEVLNRLGPCGGTMLTIPYFPYARQDRVTVEEEAFSLQCSATLLNIPIYHNIVTYDLHSQVAFQYMKKLREVKQLEIIKKHKTLTSFIEKRKPIILAPDKGALNKSFELAKEFDLPLMAAHKVRDPGTGNITVTHIPNIDLLTDNCVLIADDICDGGRTFIELGKQLKEAGVEEIALYVTHGIFSKGYEELEKFFEVIFTTDTFLSEQKSKRDFIFTHKIIEELV